jgi:hypothetical protein
MTQRLIAVLIVWLIALAALAASNAQHKQINDGLPLVNAAAPITQCTPPTLDYSHRMVRLDGRSIA